MTTIELTTQEINRPALQLAGYYEHFSHERVQIIGYVEYTYIISKDEEEQHDCFEKFISSGIPCVIFTTLTEPTVLITGESGIGKSEAALELVRRGHRLVSDDVVIIRKVSEAVLIGSAPDVTKHLIELRGIGIIDVKMLYGVEHVKDSQEIDLVIKLEDWNKEREYDRLGLEEQTTEILGNKVLCHSIPIRPGRNLAVIVETAAVNHRQKKMGYNAAHELYRRVQENLMNKKGV